jgi:hypothetical protein
MGAQSRFITHLGYQVKLLQVTDNLVTRTFQTILLKHYHASLPLLSHDNCASACLRTFDFSPWT